MPSAPRARCPARGEPIRRIAALYIALRYGRRAARARRRKACWNCAAWCRTSHSSDAPRRAGVRRLPVRVAGARGPAALRPPRSPTASARTCTRSSREMVERHGFVERELRLPLLTRAPRARRSSPPSRRRRIRRRAPGRQYRARFVTESRIAEGAEFWRRNAAALERAAREHGVPEEIIVAIIGVETVYGRKMGGWRVIDALSTLAFDYPPRAEFFRGELEQYLLFAREQGLDVFSVKGSYAGAIGIPQFMPGSYRRYAVDFDGDGGRPARAARPTPSAASANFLAQHGWQRGERDPAARARGGWNCGRHYGRGCAGCSRRASRRAQPRRFEALRRRDARRDSRAGDPGRADRTGKRRARPPSTASACTTSSC